MWWDPRIGWYTIPGGVPPGVSTQQRPPGAPPWYAGMAPAIPAPQDWPEPPTPGVAPVSPPEGGVGEAWTQKRRPHKAAWQPLDAELTRWGGVKVLEVLAAQPPEGVQPTEIARMELPFPTSCVALVWCEQLAGPGGGPALVGQVQLVAGGGSVFVPVTEQVQLVADGVARMLAPRDARAPATASFALPMSVRTLYAVASFNQGGGAPAVASSMRFGAILGPVADIW